MTPQEFDAAYWASKPPEVAALKTMEPWSAELAAEATRLALAGHIIDREVMALGAVSPYNVMKLRETYGYTWVPSLLQESVPIAPGLWQLNVASYDPSNPPAGSIMVSLVLADYLPFTPVATQEPTKAVSIPVGPMVAGIMYSRVAGETFAIGAEWTGVTTAGVAGKFVKRASAHPMGVSIWWEKVG